MNIKKQENREKQAGFTILELLIATAVFSVVLLLCATAILQVGQMFYKGVITNRIQDTSRKVANDVIGAIQNGESNLLHQKVPIAGGFAECLGTVRYTYLLTKSVGSPPAQSPHVLWKDRITAAGTCALSPVDLSAPTSGEELLGSNMRVSKFEITDLPGSSYKVQVTVAYGSDDDVFAKPGGIVDYGHCAARNLGGQFCAVSTITSYATERL